MRKLQIVSEIVMSLCAVAAIWQVPHIEKYNHKELAIFFGLLTFAWYFVYVGAKFLAKED